MRLFRKADRTARQATAIVEFWQWWSQASGEVAAAIKAGTSPDLAKAIGKRVEAIHRDMQWELSPGLNAAHGLIVTPAGNPELRAVAARWLAAAPKADEVWEYHAVRRAGPAVFTSTLKIGEASLDMGQIGYAISVDRERSQIDVTCYHPGFADLPDEARGQITFLTLDWLLGEDDVEIWLGRIDWAAAAPLKLRTPDDLRHAVEAIADDDQWAVMSSDGRNGLPRMATARVPLRSARWPRFDRHVAVALPYRTVGDGQLPPDESLQALRHFEDQLSLMIAADGVLVAHETGAAARTLHCYVDSCSDAQARIEAAVTSWTEGRAHVTGTHDPGFEKVRHVTP